MRNFTPKLLWLKERKFDPLMRANLWKCFMNFKWNLTIPMLKLIWLQEKKRVIYQALHILIFSI